MYLGTVFSYAYITFRIIRAKGVFRFLAKFAQNMHFGVHKRSIYDLKGKGMSGLPSPGPGR